MGVLGGYGFRPPNDFSLLENLTRMKVGPPSVLKPRSNKIPLIFLWLRYWLRLFVFELFAFIAAKNGRDGHLKQIPLTCSCPCVVCYSSILFCVRKRLLLTEFLAKYRTLVNTCKNM